MRMKICSSFATILLVLSLLGSLVMATDDGKGVAELTTTAEKEETWPWSCCENTRCVETVPPTCDCQDELEYCQTACVKCVEVKDRGSYYCADMYQGKNVPPKCTP